MKLSIQLSYTNKNVIFQKWRTGSVWGLALMGGERMYRKVIKG
jgi:hypothetical protein